MRRALDRINIPVLLGLVLAFNGFLNVATGLIPIFQVARYAEDVPEYLRVTPVMRTSGVLSLILGVVLIVIGKGLCERRRRSWRLALLVLCVLMANNLYRGTTPQTALLSGGLVAALVLFRRRFDIPSTVEIQYAQVIALASLTFALAYGIIGSYALRREFDGIASWTDSVYFTFVTYSTLGYGDIIPLSDNAKVFATTMVPVGLGSFITAFSVLLGPALERRLKGVVSVMERFQQLENHVVICGYSKVAESIIDDLRERGVPYVIIDERVDLDIHLKNKGHRVVAGNPSRRDPLQRANARKARAVIGASDSDSSNVLMAITAREIRDSSKGADFRILVRVEDEENIRKAKGAGADAVVSPSTLAGRMMASRALGIEDEG